jgi:hypothetical protein
MYPTTANLGPDIFYPCHGLIQYITSVIMEDEMNNNIVLNWVLMLFLVIYDIEQGRQKEHLIDE